MYSHSKPFPLIFLLSHYSLSLSLVFLKHLFLMHVREYKTAGGLGWPDLSKHVEAQDYTLDLGAAKIHN